MECRWEDNDKRKNGYLVIHLSRCHLAPHNFYVGQPGIESGPARQDCDRWQPTYSAETLPHATKSNTELTRTGPWWNLGLRGERSATSRLAHGNILKLAEIWKQTYFSFQHFPISETELLGLRFPRLYPACPFDNSSTDKTMSTETGGMTWQGKPEAAHSEKKLDNAKLSTKIPTRNGPGSNLGPRDERPVDNLLSHGTSIEACTSSHLFKLGSHRTENTLRLRYRQQNVSAIIGTNFCLFTVSYTKHNHNIGRKQTTSKPYRVWYK